jgi:tripartite-type tricarboxylate transporter receptor subunit TctC
MLLRSLLALFLMSAAVLSQAQGFPSQPIKMIIPSTPGGGTDFIGRLITSKLAEINGWTMLPVNRPGAGTALGLAEAAKGNPSGHELVIAQTDNVSLIPLLMKVSYDPIKDLVPVALVATTPMVLIVPAASPYKTLGDAIAAAKAAPGTITYGTSGTGGSVHIAIERLQVAAGFKMQHVPYKGSTPALADLVGGHLGFAGSSISSAASLLAAGKIRALAVTSPKRNPALPDVPSVRTGLQGLLGGVVLRGDGARGPAGCGAGAPECRHQQDPAAARGAHGAAGPGPGAQPADLGRIRRADPGRHPEVP